MKTLQASFGVITCHLLCLFLFPNKSLFSVESKVFGSTCYVWDVRPFVTKLDPKALKCVFLGYPCLQKVYQCYSTELGNILILVSTNMVFSKTTPFLYAPCNSISLGGGKWVVSLCSHSYFDKTIWRFSSSSHSFY